VGYRSRDEADIARAIVAALKENREENGDGSNFPIQNQAHQ
jgi:hypothetical protein